MKSKYLRERAEKIETAVHSLHKERSVAAARIHALSILRKLNLDSKAHLNASSLTLPDRKRLEVARALAAAGLTAAETLAMVCRTSAARSTPTARAA